MTQVIQGRRPLDVAMEGKAPHTPLHVVVQDAWEAQLELNGNMDQLQLEVL